MPRQPKEDPASVYTKKVCTEWVQNPLQNPLAKKKHTLKVSETGVYGKLQKNCKKLHNLEPRLTSKEKEGHMPDVPKKGAITLSQCKELEKNPHRNPMTGRKMDPTVLHGVYQRLVKECEALQAEIEEDARPSEEDAIPFEKGEKLSSSKRKKLHKIRLRVALRAALQPILHTKDTLENRIHFAKVIRKYTEHIRPCIRLSEEHPTKLVLVKAPARSRVVEEKISFPMRIGSESQYGVAYMNIGKGFAKMLRFSAKVMSTRFKHEIILLDMMSLLAEKGLTPNMPITYTHLECVALPTAEKATLAKQGVPALIAHGKYFVVLNELADGDMHHFFQHIYTPAIYESVILQMFLALRAFHKHTKCIHNDTHLGNFLYHKITPGGYWHYTYHGVNIFVPNTGYLIVLWDPGMARPIQPGNAHTNTNSPFHDYYRPLNLIYSIQTSKFYQEKHMVPVPLKAFTPFLEWLMYLRFHITSTSAMDYLVTRKERTLLQHILFDKAKIPRGETIINATPYDLT